MDVHTCAVHRVFLISRVHMYVVYAAQVSNHPNVHVIAREHVQVEVDGCEVPCAPPCTAHMVYTTTTGPQPQAAPYSHAVLLDICTISR